MQVSSAHASRRWTGRPFLRLALKLLLSVLLALWCHGRAIAGSNAGGVFFLYTDDRIIYTSDVASYAHRSGVECPEDRVGGCPPYEGLDCPEKVALAYGGCSSRRTNDAVVFWLLAEWPEEYCPRLRGVSFGIDYDAAKFHLDDWGTTADFEVSSSGAGGAWPSPLSGTALSWNGAQTSHLKEIYWFAGYVGDKPTTFAITDHPIHGTPSFADEAVPPALDPVGFDGERSILPLLGLAGAEGNQGPSIIEPDPVLVACCLPDQGCSMLSNSDCANRGGEVVGDRCDPAACSSPRGACCAIDRGCTFLSSDDCAVLGGEFLGAGIACLPASCIANPSPGACCFECPGGCVLLERDQCINVGGFFQGEGSVCDAETCPALNGACCLISENCVLATEDGCGLISGSYQGDCTTCDPNPCVSPAVERTTWGSVKHRYR